MLVGARASDGRFHEHDALRRRGASWHVGHVSSTVLNSNTQPEDPKIVALVQKDHDAAKAYVNSVIGSSLQRMSAQTAVYEDTAAMDFVNYVQADAVRQALAGTADAALPVLAIAAPFNRNAVIPQGQISVRDVAGMYIYDNTLLAVKLTGAQVKDYLEYSARYFQKVSGTGPFAPSQVTNAKYDITAPNGTPTTTTTSSAVSTRTWPTTSTSRKSWATGSRTCRTPAPRSTRRRRSWWRSTTTSPAAAASRTSRLRRWSTTGRWRFDSSSSTG